MSDYHMHLTGKTADGLLVGPPVEVSDATRASIIQSLQTFKPEGCSVQTHRGADGGEHIRISGTMGFLFSALRAAGLETLPVGDFDDHGQHVDATIIFHEVDDSPDIPEMLGDIAAELHVSNLLRMLEAGIMPRKVVAARLEEIYRQEDGDDAD